MFHFRALKVVPINFSSKNTLESTLIFTTFNKNFLKPKKRQGVYLGILVIFDKVEIKSDSIVEFNGKFNGEVSFWIISSKVPVKCKKLTKSACFFMFFTKTLMFDDLCAFLASPSLAL